MTLRISKIQIIKLVVCLICIFLILFFILLPFHNSISSIESDLTLKQQSVSSKTNKNLTTQSISADYSKYKDSLPKYEDIIDKKGNELQLITNIEKIAKRHNLVQKLALNSNPIDFDSKLSTLGLSLEVQGSYFDIINYLKEIHNFKKALSIKDIIITSNGQSLVAKLSAITYWVK